jgi:heat shock protein HtpX
MFDAVFGFLSRYLNVLIVATLLSAGALLTLKIIGRLSYRTRTKTLLLPLAGSFLFAAWISPSCYAHWLSISTWDPIHLVCNDPSYSYIRAVCTGWVALTAISFSAAGLHGVVSYYLGDRIVRRLYDVEPLDWEQAESLYGMLDALSENAGIETPSIGLIQSSRPQIMSYGKDIDSSIYVSVGFLETMAEDEVRASFAHEVAHISNGDTLVRSLANSLKIASMFNLIGFLIEPALCRDREFLADEEGARLSGDPNALMSALIKLSEAPPMRSGSFFMGGMSLSLFPSRNGWSVFSRHPPVEERLRRLAKLDVIDTDLTS